VAYRRGRRQPVSFAELARRVPALAGGLQALGIAPGDRVLLFVPMSIDLYLLVLACLHLGAAVVFLDAWADRRRLDAAVAAARPRAFIGTPRAHLLRLLSPAVRRIPLRVLVGAPGSGLERLEREAIPPAPVAAETAALVTLTTGSTGRPKAAARSHGFLWTQHQVLNATLGLAERDVDLATLPVFVLNNLAAGATTVLPDFDARRPAEFDPAAVYRQLVAEGVTTSGGSPAFYARLAGWCRAQRLRLPLRALFTGGAPVLPPLARLLLETVTGEVRIIYGSTEAEPIAEIAASELLALVGGGGEGLPAGVPVPAIDVRLLRPVDGPVDLGPGGWEGWEAPPGEVGEIVVAGPHVLAGYLDDPAADREHKIRDGERTWHRTGDAGRFDGEGRLWLMGRVKERVRRAGEVVWPLPAELRALAVPGIAHAAYLGLPPQALGQRAVLCVETPSGQLPSGLSEQLLAALAPVPVDDLLMLHRIPRDPRHASKTDLIALRRLLRG
jgi:acyl-CoA synthetase (AMP-forming)/AMP-acid ligase II